MMSPIPKSEQDSLKQVWETSGYKKISGKVYAHWKSEVDGRKLFPRLSGGIFLYYRADEIVLSTEVLHISRLRGKYGGWLDNFNRSPSLVRFPPFAVAWVILKIFDRVDDTKDMSMSQLIDHICSRGAAIRITQENMLDVEKQETPRNKIRLKIDMKTVTKDWDKGIIFLELREDQFEELKKSLTFLK